MKLLCLCDSPTLVSGFARVAQNLMTRWAAAGAEIDVWGIGFAGWGYQQHPYLRSIFPAGSGVAADHWAGADRLSLFLAQLQSGGYTHVWILQDTFQLVNWDFPQAFRKVCTVKKIKSMMYFPVDARLDPEWTDILAAVDVPVAFTNFGREEALYKLNQRAVQIKLHNLEHQAQVLANQQTGAPVTLTPIDIEGLNYCVEVYVLPHGVDTKIYQPVSERTEKRKAFWKTEFAKPDDFLMVNVNVNQRRKDVSRSLELLKAVRALGVPAKLILHMGCVSDDGVHLEKVGAQLGLKCNEDWSHHDHLFVRGQGRFTQDQLNELYNIADLYLTTTLGEGWGLGITEALAAGTPVALPLHTSCKEIWFEMGFRGMEDQVVGLPVEDHWLVQGMDLSRCRRRVTVSAAAVSIKDYYDSGVWKLRPGLNQSVRDWLSWDRIAKEMRQLYRGASSFKTQDSSPASETITLKT